jgi:hypothetical protein
MSILGMMFKIIFYKSGVLLRVRVRFRVMVKVS